MSELLRPCVRVRGTAGCVVVRGCLSMRAQPAWACVVFVHVSTSRSVLCL